MILPGMFSSIYEWYPLINRISEFARVIAVHRKGLGKSDKGEEEPSTMETVKDLKELLRFLQINQKVFFIGHSYGGLIIQDFISTYPEQVKGVLLVDSSSVEMDRLDELVLPVMDEESSDEAWIDYCRKQASFTTEELKEQNALILTQDQKHYPLEIQQELLSFPCSPILYEVMAQEVENWREDANRIKRKQTVLRFPVIALGRDRKYCQQKLVKAGIPEDEARSFEEMWEKLIEDQANISQIGSCFFLRDTTHLMWKEKPEEIIHFIRLLSHTLLL
ncbi:alpha/beta fold hydrolase [Bacillus sp. 2205SS5-2]|uniref:alpha/beta fold hydrolase n=1 Tax=Bacillus sp. 2205SS5-2 TaxID=3109031 RepID=UPI003004981F